MNLFIRWRWKLRLLYSHLCVCVFSGYGHTVPLSDGGKAFCIFFSVVGIPVTLFFLSVAVQRLMVLVTRRPLAHLHRHWAVSRSRLALWHAACLTLLTVLLLILIPAWIFTNLEKDWSFLESLYFCFISLTTVGLGDYVPGETHSKDINPHPHLYRLAITGRPSPSDHLTSWVLEGAWKLCAGLVYPILCVSCLIGWACLPARLPAAGPALRPGADGDLLRASPGQTPLAEVQPSNRPGAGLRDHQHHRAGPPERPGRRPVRPGDAAPLRRHPVRVRTGSNAAAGRISVLGCCWTWEMRDVEGAKLLKSLMQTLWTARCG